MTDADGRPVTDLTAEDFQILENGVLRPVVAFSLVNIPIPAARGRVGTWPADPDIATNDDPEGRLYVIALDEVHPEHVLRTRLFLRQFLEEHFGPHDVAGVVLTGRGLVTTGQSFTRSPRLVLDAIDQFTGGFAMELGAAQLTRFHQCVMGDTTPTVLGRMDRLVGNERSFPARARMASLRGLLESVAGLPGGRKIVVYVSECLGVDMFEVVDYRGGVLTLEGEDAHAAMAAATRGNVIVYPIDPAGLTVDDVSSGLAQEARADLASLARVTGGFALTNSNRFNAAFERVVRENSTYYVLGFDSAYDRRDGRLVRVEVRVNRSGLQVRAPEGYIAPLGTSGRPAAGLSRVAASMASPITTRGLPLRFFAAPFKGTGRDAVVVLAVEIDVSALDLAEQDGLLRGTIELSYLATDSRDNAYPGAIHAFTVTGRDRPADGQWLRVVSQMPLPPGQYQLRVAAGAATQSGSVVYDLSVPDFTRAPLVMSGLALTATSAANTATLRPAPASGGSGNATRCRPPSCIVPLQRGGADGAGDPLSGGLPAPLTTTRTFDRSDTIALFGEVYRNLPETSLSTIEITTAVREADGRVLASATEQYPPGAPRQPSGGYGFTLLLPLQEVPPGQYLLHAEARVAGDIATPVSRAVPITVR